MSRLRCKGCGKFISPNQVYAYIDGEFFCFRKWCKELVREMREAELILWAEETLGKSLSEGEDEEEFKKKFK